MLSECWDATPNEPWVEALTAGIDDSIRETIPREIVLLMRLKHENIVRAIEVFHNEDMFQLVSNALTYPRLNCTNVVANTVMPQQAHSLTPPILTPPPSTL